MLAKKYMNFFMKLKTKNLNIFLFSNFFYRNNNLVVLNFIYFNKKQKYFIFNLIYTYQFGVLFFSNAYLYKKLFLHFNVNYAFAVYSLDFIKFICFFKDLFKGFKNLTLHNFINPINNFEYLNFYKKDNKFYDYNKNLIEKYWIKHKFSRPGLNILSNNINVLFIKLKNNIVTYKFYKKLLFYRSNMNFIDNFKDVFFFLIINFIQKFYKLNIIFCSVFALNFFFFLKIMANLRKSFKMSKKIKKKYHCNPVRVLMKSPQKRATVNRVKTRPPKKPNSAKRAVAKVTLVTGRKLWVKVKGSGHSLQSFAEVLVCGGRANDLPGVRCNLIKGGAYGFPCAETIFRVQARSKYGEKYKDLQQALADKFEKEIEELVIKGSSTNHDVSSLIIKRFGSYEEFYKKPLSNRGGAYYYKQMKNVHQAIVASRKKRFLKNKKKK